MKYISSIFNVQSTLNVRTKLSLRKSLITLAIIQKYMEKGVCLLN